MSGIKSGLSSHLILLTPSPKSWRLHAEKRERVLAYDDQPNQEQFENG